MTVQMMTLSEIQSIVDNSIDFGSMTTAEDWERMVVSKSLDPGMGYLVEDMRDNGYNAAYPIPIVDGTITEGHHRLAAAILLCLDAVAVSDDYVMQYWPENCGGLDPGMRPEYGIDLE